MMCIWPSADLICHLWSCRTSVVVRSQLQATRSRKRRAGEFNITPSSVWCQHCGGDLWGSPNLRVRIYWKQRNSPTQTAPRWKQKHHKLANPACWYERSGAWPFLGVGKEQRDRTLTPRMDALVNWRSFLCCFFGWLSWILVFPCCRRWRY